MGDAKRGRSDLIRWTRALVLGVIVLAGCSPTLGAELGDGELVADEAVYPGAAGPLLGEVATSQDEVDGLWDTLGLPGQSPTLGSRSLVVVAGGEPEDCPWRLGEVSVDPDHVVVAVRPNGWFTRWRAGGECDGDWSPRTVAFTVPGDAVDHDTQVAIDLPWDSRHEPSSTRPVGERPDPELWAERVLTVGDLGDAWGCESAYVTASTPGHDLRLMVDFSGPHDQHATDVFRISGDLPFDGVTVTLLSGSDITADLCSDIVERHRPLVAGRWVAASGHLDVAVHVEDRSGYRHPLATVVLRDVTLDPVDPAEGKPWRIEELRFTDAPIGGFAG